MILQPSSFFFSFHLKADMDHRATLNIASSWRISAAESLGRYVTLLFSLFFVFVFFGGDIALRAEAAAWLLLVMVVCRRGYFGGKRASFPLFLSFLSLFLERPKQCPQTNLAETDW